MIVELEGSEIKIKCSLTFTTSRVISKTTVLGTFKVERRLVAKLQSTKVSFKVT